MSNHDSRDVILNRITNRVTLLAAAGAAFATFGGLLAAPAQATEVVSCDTLEKGMAGATGAGIRISPYGQNGGGSAVDAIKYLAMYGMAHAKKCEFLNKPANPYHVRNVEPGERGVGASFSLQTYPAGNANKGVILEVQGDASIRGAGNKSNMTEIPQSQFAYVATGLRAPDSKLRLYKLLVTGGAHAGECVEQQPHPAGYPTAVTRKCGEANTYFTSQEHNSRWGPVLGHFMGHYLAAYKWNGSSFEYAKTLGILDNRRKGISVFKKQEYDEPTQWQHFFYRPVGKPT
ncbi:hypothetical protein [Streptomyces sp. NPDC051577]|uniref:hypothetical protein n=1 Tax=Streptomyces sp. NPDC051577 TaxID=3155166 RepID=UPI00344308B3